MIEGRGDAARSAVAVRIVTQRPMMNIRSARESFQVQPAVCRIAHLRKSCRAIPARAPAARHVLDISEKVIATTLQPNGHAVRRAPFIRRSRVEETNQHVKLPALTDYFPGSTEWIVEGFCRDDFCVVGRLGCGL